MDRLSLTAAIVLLAAPVAAQEVELDLGPLTACLAASPGEGARSDCVGLAASHCQAGPLGGSNLGYGACFAAEHDYWDARLNAAYRALRAREAARDAENAEYAAHAPPLEATLIRMQRDWISFRDSTCDWHRAQFGGGTGGGPAVAECQMQQTGRQALYLERMLGGG